MPQSMVSLFFGDRNQFSPAADKRERYEQLDLEGLVYYHVYYVDGIKNVIGPMLYSAAQDVNISYNGCITKNP